MEGERGRGGRGGGGKEEEGREEDRRVGRGREGRARGGGERGEEEGRKGTGSKRSCRYLRNTICHCKGLTVRKHICSALTYTSAHLYVPLSAMLGPVLSLHHSGGREQRSRI